MLAPEGASSSLFNFLFLLDLMNSVTVKLSILLFWVVKEKSFIVASHHEMVVEQ